jgi:hypothetical protein
MTSAPNCIPQPLPLAQAGSSPWILREVPAPLLATLGVALRVANLFKSEDCSAGKTLSAHCFVVYDMLGGDGDALSLEMILTLAFWVLVR